MGPSSVGGYHPLAMRTAPLLLSVPLLAAAVGVGCTPPALGPDYVYGRIAERTGHSVSLSAGEDGTLSPIPHDWSPGSELSEPTAVALALRNSPDLAASLEDLGIARADWKQAGLLRNPDATFLIRFFTGGAFGFQNNLAVGLPTEIGGQIFFRRKIAELNWSRTAERLAHDGVRLIADVKAVHAEMRAARLRQAVNAKAVEVLSAGVAIARKRYEAGDTGLQEVALTEAELARARLDADRFERDLATARERLNRLMGLDPATPWTLTTPLEEGPPAAWTVEDLMARAVADRLDVRAAEIEAEAASERVGLQWANVLPTVVFGIAQQAETNTPSQVGPLLALPLPIFDQNLAQVDRAKAELRKAARLYAVARIQAVAEVRRAFEQWRKTRTLAESYRAALLPKLGEAVRYSEAAFENGQESFLTVLLARRGLIDAQAQQAGVLLELALARIELERAVGGKLP
jgi:cobalt-zinc-cadmium efflux system outer membrane protein